MKKFLAFLILIASLIWIVRRMPAEDSAWKAEQSIGLIPYVQAATFAAAGEPDDELDMVILQGGYMMAQNPLPFLEEIKPGMPAILEKNEVMRIAYLKNKIVFGEEHWEALYQLLMRESGWQPNAINKISGACGLFQALPCKKMGCEFSDINCQINWGFDYIRLRYLTPEKALEFQIKNGWY